MAEMTGLSLGCFKRVPSLCPSSPAWVSPDRRRKGGVTVMLADILRSCDCLEGFVGGWVDGVGSGTGIGAVSHKDL